MKISTILLSIVVISTLLTSCAKVFTLTDERLIASYNQPIRTVQLFNDRDIVLRREIPYSDAKLETTSSGVVRIEAGKSIEYVTIPKGTMGVCVEHESAKEMVVSFDKRDSQSLNFYSDRSGTMYRLGFNGTFLGVGGMVMYEGQAYKVVEGHTARLLFKNEIKYKQDTSGKKAKGRSVTEDRYNSN